jgi:methionyl-tRNA formyltransferase
LEQAGSRTAPAGTVLGTDAQQGILVQTEEGVFAIRRLQYSAKKALAWKDFLNGARNFIGALLT